MNRDRSEQCAFCKKSFSSEHILLTHVCLQKQRYNDRNSAASRIAYFAYDKMWRFTTRSDKSKAFSHFSTSKLYAQFIRFARHMVLIDPFNLEAYIIYLLVHEIKIKLWTDDEMYLEFVQDFLRLEPPLKAFERSFVFITGWAHTHGVEYKEFFKKINPDEAILLIQNGRLSPWVLYLSASSRGLLTSFTDDENNMVEPFLDPAFWTDRLAAKREDAAFIGKTLCDAGL